MLTKTILAAGLASVVAAAPVAERQSSNTFTIISTRSGSEFHLRSIAANGQRFWIGKESATYCPEVQDIDCAQYSNYTSLGAQPNTDSGLSLNVVVPGGQQSYVTADGQLGYTIAHSASTPEGALRAPFLYTPQASEGTVGNLQFNAQGFAACPSEAANVYQIYATGAPSFNRTDCTGINIATSSSATVTPAWQFT